MKKVVKYMAIAIIAVLMAGCTHKVDMTITNSDMKVTVLTDVIQTDDETLVKNGYKVVDKSEGDDEDDMSTLKEISKSYKLSKISGSDPVEINLMEIGEESFDDSQYFQKVSSNLFGTTYKATFIFDVSDVEEGSNDFAYSVTLPSKPIKHNADKVEGKKLTWTIKEGEVNAIEYEFKVTNMTLVYGIIGVVVIAGAGIAVAMSKKKKQPGADQQNFGQPEMPYPQTPQQ